MKLTDNELKAREYICLALDLDDKEEIIRVVDEMFYFVGYFKLNFAFTNYGPEIVEHIRKKGGKVFLDLKFHDIPNTVAGYARAVTLMKADIFNIHALGGKEMMMAAAKAAEEEADRDCSTRPKVIAVTVLTSHDEQSMNSLGILGTIDDEVMRLAKLAADSEMDGIVCSANELEKIRPHLPDDFYYITPGIRPVGADKGDQKRVMTPSNAIKAGASLLVIGRAILDAKDRRAAALEIIKDIASVI